MITKTLDENTISLMPEDSDDLLTIRRILKVDDKISEKKELEKIVLCDVQNEIYPDIEKSLLDLLHNSGYPEIKFEKKINFESLYNQKFN